MRPDIAPGGTFPDYELPDQRASREGSASYGRRPRLTLRAATARTSTSSTSELVARRGTRATWVMARTAGPQTG